MRFTAIFLAASAASTVIASGADIVASLGTITTDTQTLESTVSGWSGDIFGAIPIATKSLVVLESIKKGTQVAQASANLTGDESLAVAGAVSSLATTVNTTITAIISKHTQFKRILIAPIVLGNLNQEKSAADDLSAAIIAKVPEALQAIAEQLAAPISDSFSLGIDAFALSNGI